MKLEGDIIVDMKVVEGFGKSIVSKQIGEIVLDDGRCISIYKRKTIHDFMAKSECEQKTVLKLIALLTKIDGEQTTFEDILNLDHNIFSKICGIILED